MNNKAHIDNISIIMPAFNEAGNIEQTVKRCFSTLKELGQKGEVIVTDDGSQDGTLKVLQSLSAQFPELKIIVHLQNEGYGAALKDAAQAAQGDYIVSIDSDGQFDIAEIHLLIEEMNKGYDVVTGYRKKKKDSFFKVIANRGFNLITQVLFGISFKDTNCAFKLYNSGIFDKINIEAQGYPAPTEILVKLHTLGFKIGQVGISHFYREKGKSALSPFRTIYKMLLFLFYLRIKISLYRKGIIKNL